MCGKTIRNDGKEEGEVDPTQLFEMKSSKKKMLLCVYNEPLSLGLFYMISFKDFMSNFTQRNCICLS